MNKEERIRKIAEKYVYGKHNALTDSQEIEDMINDIKSLNEESKECENIKQIRDNFFAECTDEFDSLQKVSLTPHNVFEWFKPYLSKNNSVSDEEIENKIVEILTTPNGTNRDVAKEIIQLFEN